MKFGRPFVSPKHYNKLKSPRQSNINNAEGSHPKHIRTITIN